MPARSSSVGGRGRLFMIGVSTSPGRMHVARIPSLLKVLCK
jgi:hypothetical protein